MPCVALVTFSAAGQSTRPQLSESTAKEKYTALQSVPNLGLYVKFYWLYMYIQDTWTELNKFYAFLVDNKDECA